MTDQDQSFTERTDHPYDGCTSFLAAFSTAMMENPAVRPMFEPLVAEVATWCTERFGPSGNTKVWDFSSMGVFYFDDPAAAFEFKMRWC